MMMQVQYTEEEGRYMCVVVFIDRTTYTKRRDRSDSVAKE